MTIYLKSIVKLLAGVNILNFRLGSNTVTIGVIISVVFFLVFCKYNII